MRVYQRLTSDPLVPSALVGITVKPISNINNIWLTLKECISLTSDKLNRFSEEKGSDLKEYTDKCVHKLETK